MIAPNRPNAPEQNSQLDATTTNRRAILDRLRSVPVDSPALETIETDRLTVFDNPLDTFLESLAFVGGEAHLVDTHADIADRLSEIQVFADAKRISSLVPEAVQGNIDASLVDDPHGLATLDWTIARGEFAVAENGAIWIDGATMPHRVMIFIAQYLAIVVSRSQLVSNMHQAYTRIGQPSSPFGIFVSGPSKTADIEQSLVLGAHGCRKLQVFLLP